MPLIDVGGDDVADERAEEHEQRLRCEGEDRQVVDFAAGQSVPDAGAELGDEAIRLARPVLGRLVPHRAVEDAQGNRPAFRGEAAREHRTGGLVEYER